MDSAPSALPPGVALVDLRERPDVMLTVARWLKETFLSRRPHLTLEVIEGWLRGDMAGAPVPRAWVAVAGAAPVGCARLVAADHPGEPDLTPWLAMVFVVPAWRRRGIASGLVRTIQAAARAAGYPTLYLHTRDQAALYARHGFASLRTIPTPDGASTCTLMAWATGAAAPAGTSGHEEA